MNICVYLDSKHRTYCSLKIFGLMSRYLKDIRDGGVIIGFHPNFIGRGFNYGKKDTKLSK